MVTTRDNGKGVFVYSKCQTWLEDGCFFRRFPRELCFVVVEAIKHHMDPPIPPGRRDRTNKVIKGELQVIKVCVFGPCCKDQKRTDNPEEVMACLSSLDFIFSDMRAREKAQLGKCISLLFLLGLCSLKQIKKIFALTSYPDEERARAAAGKGEGGGRS